MKKAAWAAMCVCVALMIGAAWSADESTPVRNYSTDQGFVAHEWGMMVADARHPYGPKEIGEDLRDIPVYCSNIMANARWSGREAGGGKPVIFFYAPEEVKATVTVEAKSGSLMFCAPTAGILYGEFPEQSYSYGFDPQRAFRWRNILVLPKTEAAEMAAVPAGHWWNDCREVDCAVVKVPKGLASYDGNGGIVLAEDQFEKFLFYDGSDIYKPAAEWEKTDKGVSVTNKNAHAMKDVYVISREKDGATRWGYVASLDKGATEVVAWADSGRAMKEHFQSAQVGAGLYQDEAEAFWAAWKKQILENDGVRVLYRIPQATLEECLPLTIEPKPAKVVRVDWALCGK